MRETKFELKSHSCEQPHDIGKLQGIQGEYFIYQ